MTKNPYIGSSLDSLLQDESVLEQVDAMARKRLIAWQLSQAMAKKNLTKTQMAQVMKTSRACLNRLLDPDNPSVTLLTMERAGAALGMELRVELVERDPEEPLGENLELSTTSSRSSRAWCARDSEVSCSADNSGDEPSLIADR